MGTQLSLEFEYLIDNSFYKSDPIISCVTKLTTDLFLLIFVRHYRKQIKICPVVTVLLFSHFTTSQTENSK